MDNNDSIDYSVLMRNLKALFESRGQSIRSVATDMGISDAALSRYLSGARVPDLRYVMLIASYYNVSIDWLVGFSESKTDVNPEAKEISELYSIATEDDRTVIRAVLAKYKKE